VKRLRREGHPPLSEFSHLGGTLKIVKYHGKRRNALVASFDDSDIVITTYHRLSMEARTKASPVHDTAWYRVVLDEGEQQCTWQYCPLGEDKCALLTMVFSPYDPSFCYNVLPNRLQAGREFPLVPHRHSHSESVRRYRSSLCFYSSPSIRQHGYISKVYRRTV
jgi:hypothetical protein